MAARVTATEVKEIISTSLSDAIVNAYIAAATAMVDEVVGDSTALGDDLKKEIERWLAAHMIATTRERMGAEEGAGGAYIKYTGEYGQNLSSSPYGQMVLTLDSTGYFASLGRKAATITAIESFDS